MRAEGIQLRRGFADDWFLKNPILRAGEPAFEVDSRLMKVGDGITAWNDLPYVNQVDGDGNIALNAHINSATPHPAYDDGPSFELLYQNAKV